MSMKRIRIGLLVLFLICAAVVTTACLKKVDEADTTAKETQKEAETTQKSTETEEDKKDDVFEIPEFVNPLTGLGTKTDISNKRPVSVMVNNIGASLPQVGVAQADILYECLAEGGITRLMLISNDYEKLSKIGSVRSARDYYIDYADGYDCIFVHAGGSTYAYNTFSQRGTDRVDGVNGPAYLHSGTGTFLRDPERLNKYAYEHTLVVESGEGIKKAIEYYGYRTEKNTGYEAPMNFVDFEKSASYANKATHAKVVMSNYQTVDFVYDSENGEYLRYQYNGDPHIDGATGEQLSFKNVVIIFTSTAAIPGDEKARIDIGTTGSGNGWVLTDGTYQKITWKKENHASGLKFYFEDGTEVQFNRGKTMINVVPTYNESLVTFDDQWKDK